MSFIKEPLARFAEWATHSQKKRVYAFHEGSASDKALLGNKGANLCEMVRLGLPVPLGFIISTEACTEYFQDETCRISTQLVDEYTKYVHDLERQTGRFFGGSVPAKDPKDIRSADGFPLLLSVRSGAAVSMPGMMDTVLNLGMNDEVVQLIARFTNNPRFAFDTYRRFLQMYGDVVLGVDNEKYEAIITAARARRGVEHDSELYTADLQAVVEEFKKLADVPSDPWDQLRSAIESVFCSWYNPRAVTYRDINNIPQEMGTAVTIQSMVYGNWNNRSGSGVAFTRNPGTGENAFFGEFLNNAEGEDVVAGARTPVPVSDLRHQMPGVYDQLCTIEKKLERHYRDMQDIEFTIENGHLYILQTRRGKRTAQAAVKIAVDMVHENLITEREALLRIDAEQCNYFLHPMIDPSIAATGLGGLASRLICVGIPASAGAAIGVLAFSCDEAIALKNEGKKVILCREATSADDIAGLHAADGVLTLRGGMTSHAAIVMRGMGKSAVVGAKSLHIDIAKRELQVISPFKTDSPTVLRGGKDLITIDGSSGQVYRGEVPTVTCGQDENFQTILRWASRYKKMGVLANAETVQDVSNAMTFGAEGVGLVRTEHCFFQGDRLNTFRAAILADTVEERAKHLKVLERFQQEDFINIYHIVGGGTPSESGKARATAAPISTAMRAAERAQSGKFTHQCTIRLLDPPLAEFLPNARDPDYLQQVAALASQVGLSPGECMQRCTQLQENNPLMGFRGVRIGIVHPDITAMQVRAIMRAALTVLQEGIAIRPEIMIPNICSDHELSQIVPVIREAAEEVFMDREFIVDYSVGVMLESPRACLRADSIVTPVIHAQSARKRSSAVDVAADQPLAAASTEGPTLPGIRFCSVGTNDLTALVYGFSRDDCGQFLREYIDKGIFANDPFKTLDQRGVGTMIQLAIQKIRKTNPNVKIGICGEHGGDPDSIKFFEKLDLDYVSCSPFRVPIAKIACAQAHIESVSRDEAAAKAQLWALLSESAIM